MRPEWFEPLQTSMAELGVVAVWFEQNLSQVSQQLVSDVDGIVLELSNEVVGSAGLHQFRSWGPLAGIPVEDGSAAIAEALGIVDVIWCQDQACQWLVTLQASHPALPPPLFAVWGAPGAPGASQFAIGIALEIAENRPTVVIDADFVAPSIAELLTVSGESNGLLGALRVCRNDNPSWDSVMACAAPLGSSDSLHVLSGVRPGSLGRMEAASMSTLLGLAASEGVAVVVETKCSLGSPERSPERNAVEAIVRSAQHLYVVARGTDLGVTRLVRDWELLQLENLNSRITCVIRTPQESRDSAFSRASEALWALTGCSDIRSAPDLPDAAGSSGVAHLLEGVRRVSGSSTELPQAERKGLRESLAALMTPHRRQPLP